MLTELRREADVEFVRDVATLKTSLVALRMSRADLQTILQHNPTLSLSATFLIRLDGETNKSTQRNASQP